MSPAPHQPSLFSWKAPAMSDSSWFGTPGKDAVDAPEDEEGWLFADGSIPTDLWGLHLQLYECIERFLEENPDLPLKRLWCEDLTPGFRQIRHALAAAIVWAFDDTYGTEGGDCNRAPFRPWIQTPDLTVSSSQVLRFLRSYWSDAGERDRFSEQLLAANKHCGRSTGQ